MRELTKEQLEVVLGYPTSKTMKLITYLKEQGLIKEDKAIAAKERYQVGDIVECLYDSRLYTVTEDTVFLSCDMGVVTANGCVCYNGEWADSYSMN